MSIETPMMQIWDFLFVAFWTSGLCAFLAILRSNQLSYPAEWGAKLMRFGLISHKRLCPEPRFIPYLVNPMLISRLYTSTAKETESNKTNHHDDC